MNYESVSSIFSFLLLEQERLWILKYELVSSTNLKSDSLLTMLVIKNSIVVVSSNDLSRNRLIN